MPNPLSDAISQAYNIRNITCIKKLELGHLTENSLIESESGRFFLKKHRDKVMPRIGYIEAVEQFFYGGGISVIMPLLTQDGCPHLTYEGHTYTLYPFANRPQHKRSELSDTNIESLARTLAKMHLLSKNGMPTDLIESRPESWDTDTARREMVEIREIILKKAMCDELDEMALKALTIKLAFADSNTVTANDLGTQNDTIVHGDYHDQNVFFDDFGRVSHVFDFEKARMSSRMLELTRSMLLICFEFTYYREENFLKAEKYLKAYQELYPVERGPFLLSLKLNILKYFYSTWIEGEYYLKNNSRISDFFPGNYSTVEYMSHSQEEFEAKVMSFIDS